MHLVKGVARGARGAFALVLRDQTSGRHGSVKNDLPIVTRPDPFRLGAYTASNNAQC